MIHVWLALEIETGRVTMQDSPFIGHDFPRGLRGQGWAFREAEITEADWDGIMSGTYSGGAVDDLHRALWTANGDTPWPSP